MTDEELLELEAYTTMAQSAGVIDYMGIDNYLIGVLQFVSNPEQEQVIQSIINALRKNTHTLH